MFSKCHFRKRLRYAFIIVLSICGRVRLFVSMAVLHKIYLVHSFEYFVRCGGDGLSLVSLTLLVPHPIAILVQQ